MKHEPTKPLPAAHPDYQPAPTQRVRIGRRDCVDVCGSKFPELVRHVEFYTRGPKL